MRTHNSHSRGSTDNCTGIALFTAARHIRRHHAPIPAHPFIHFFSLFLSEPQDLLSTAIWTGVGSTNFLIPEEDINSPMKGHLFLYFCVCYKCNCFSDQFQYTFWSLLVFLHPPYSGHAYCAPHKLLFSFPQLVAWRCRIAHALW